MRLDLRDIIHIPGAQKPFGQSLDLSGWEHYGEKPFPQPIQVSGTVRNMAGALVLTGKAEGTLTTRCDRCLKPLELPYVVEVETLLAEELANAELDRDGEEILLLEDGGVDLDELFTTECILSVEGKHLCREDCRGLCPKCGKDLNDGPCDCAKELDPRFAVLAKLLDTDPDGSDET